MLANNLNFHYFGTDAKPTESLLHSPSRNLQNSKFKICGLLGEEDFAHLPCDVTVTFFARRNLLKDKLKKYELDAFFLSDSHRRGRGTIRGYIKSFHFDKFTPNQYETGGKYVSFLISSRYVLCYLVHMHQQFLFSSYKKANIQLEAYKFHTSSMYQ